MDVLNVSSLPSEEENPAFVPWGCELNKDRTSCTFKVKDDLLEHLLFLRTICLGAEAKDELHVVAVESKNTYHGDPLPIASLRISILPMINVNGLEFTPPVTFILKSGTGPVYICAQHLTLEDLEEEEEEEEEDDDGLDVGDADHLEGEGIPSPEEFQSHLGRESQADDGQPWTPSVVKRTWMQITNDPTLNHEYLPVLGTPEFTRVATELVLGKGSAAIVENRAGGVQTLGGTGALRIGAEFLYRWYSASTPNQTAVYISEPTWESHRYIFQEAGFTDIYPYRYWDSEKLTLAVKELMDDLENAPDFTIVVMDTSAHNPTGIGLASSEWEWIADMMLRKRMFPFFHLPAQGLISGDLERDSWPVRCFAEKGLELFCAQSFSRNFGLYGERVGNLIIITKQNKALLSIRSQLQKHVRATWGSPPAIGARIVTTILNNPALFAEWKENLKVMVERMMLIREKLKEKLRNLGVMGSWDHITEQAGIYTFTGLTPSQVDFLIQHIDLNGKGQINISCLNHDNLDYVTWRISEAVAATIGSRASDGKDTMLTFL